MRPFLALLIIALSIYRVEGSQPQIAEAVALAAANLRNVPVCTAFRLGRAN